MIDWRSLASLSVLITTYCCYWFYFYETFFGTWEKIHCRGFFYIVTAITLGYFLFDEMRNYYFVFQYHIKIAHSLSVIAMFFLFFLLLWGKLDDYHGLVLFVYTTIVLFVTISILWHGIKYKLFKHP